MFYKLPNNPRLANPLLERFMRENIGVSQENIGIRRRPSPVQSLRVTALAGAVKLSWQGPSNLAGILGYNVYQGNEHTLVQNVVAPQYPSASSQGSNLSVPPTLSAVISALASGVPVNFLVSAYTSLLESVKLPIIGVPA